MFLLFEVIGGDVSMRLPWIWRVAEKYVVFVESESRNDEAVLRGSNQL